jgi:hypothetical protein
MEDMELLECLIETEIKTLEYKIQLARNAQDTQKRNRYQSERAGLKRVLGFIYKIQDMEEEYATE